MVYRKISLTGEYGNLLKTLENVIIVVFEKITNIFVFLLQPENF